MNIEATVVQFLNKCGYKAYADIPAKRPDEFITVERTGGNNEVGISRPTVAVQCWSTTRYKASEFMNEVDEQIQSMVTIPEIARVSLNGCYNFPDSSGTPRYQAIYDFVTY